MTTTNEPTIEDLNPGLKGLGTYEYGWADSDTAGATKRGTAVRPASTTAITFQPRNNGVTLCSRCQPSVPGRAGLAPLPPACWMG